MPASDSPAGRPVSIWMQHETIDALDERAQHYGFNRSELVMKLIRAELTLSAGPSQPAPRAD